MKRAFLFCPENDIALGRGCARFTPPRQAALLARYGAPVMWWLGNEDDYVVLPTWDNVDYGVALEQWESEMTSRFGTGPRLVTTLSGLEVDRLCPWGWSSYSASRFQSLGIALEALQREMPDCERVRMLSHRRSATFINEALALNIDWHRYGQSPPGGAVECYSSGEVGAYIAARQAFYVKSPWSSSGRGVVCSKGIARSRMLERCESIIRSQGSVMLEPSYCKVLDFAMLFESVAGGKVVFHGYSQFSTSHATAYSGNRIASDGDIFRNLTRYVEASLLDDVRTALERILPRLTDGVYQGYMGIDMMIASTAEGRFFLVPCVELNLRMTMGVIAHSVYRKCNLTGEMVMSAGTSDNDLKGFTRLIPANPCFNIVFRESLE